jgi:flagellar biogenesis protein FliO
MVGFLERIYLVSLCLGKLVVGLHQRSSAVHSAPLTWSSEKHYPTPAYLSAPFKVALHT